MLLVPATLLLLAAGPAGPRSPGAAVEPPGIAKLVRAAEKGAVERAFDDAGVADACRAGVTGGDLRGLQCRLVAMRALAPRTLADAADVDARAALTADAVGVGVFIDSWVPRAPEPGLRRLKLDAQKLACEIAFAGVTDLEALPPGHPGQRRARELLASVAPTRPSPTSAKPGLRDAACACARRAADMAVAADAPADEHAALQGLLTRQRCNVAGELKITERRDPSKGFDAGNAEIRAAAAASSPEGRLVELARGRALDLGRCTDKHVSLEGRVKQPEKLTSCACGVVKRWSLPVKKDDPVVSARLPLVGDVVLPVTVEGGQISSCGPVDGAVP